MGGEREPKCFTWTEHQVDLPSKDGREITQTNSTGCPFVLRRFCRVELAVWVQSDPRGCHLSSNTQQSHLDKKLFAMTSILFCSVGLSHPTGIS